MTQDEIFSKLWDELVPQSGDAKTIQGEVIRAFGRLQYEWLNNGNGNWDNTYFAEMLDSIWGKLVPNDDEENELDAETISEFIIPFDAERIKQIQQDLRLIGMLGFIVMHGHIMHEQSEQILQIFSSDENTDEYHRDSFSRVRDAIIDWCRANPDLKPIYGFSSDSTTGSIKHIFE